MVNEKSVIAVICARGGSKGLPGKNIKPLAGKPLIAWSIEAAKNAATIDRLILSSDDPLIIETAGQFGCETPVPRPIDLATDDSPVEAAILYTLDRLDEKYDYVTLLQPTSPLRNSDDIDGCNRLCIELDAPFGFTVFDPPDNPNLSFYLGPDDRLDSVFGEDFYKLKSRRRQDLPEILAPNGAVFVARVQDLRKARNFYGKGAVGYRMPPERSIDIDSELDFVIAAALMEEIRKSG